ncbi:hypothetical protein [Methanolobus vulcani]|nr:hypothetical protein [Methanolobus vulcani]
MVKVKRDSTAFIIVDAQNFVLHEKGANAEWEPGNSLRKRVL